MKQRILLIAVIALALLLSGASLALQVRQNRNASNLDELAKPTVYTKLERGLIFAELDMIRGRIPVENGMGPGRIHGLSADQRAIVIRIDVFSNALPSNFNQRKQLFNIRASFDVASLKNAFEGRLADNEVLVEFVDHDWSATQGKPKVVATFRNGELTLKD